MFLYLTETSLLYKTRIWKSGPIFAPFKFGLVVGLQFLAESDGHLSESAVFVVSLRALSHCNQSNSPSLI